MIIEVFLFLVLLLGVAFIVMLSFQASKKWTVGKIIRTPDEAFANLPDYPFAPNYIDSLGYRVHYVDEGPRDGPVVLLMHGQPTWSYLYRHMIPILVEAGFRVIAPDNVGFGKSDKPVNSYDHSYQMHIDVMTNFVDQLEIQEVTFFGQDWGGLIGLRVVAELPNIFSRIMLSNTGLPAASGIKGWIGYPFFRFSVWRRGNVQSLDRNSDNFDFIEWVAYARHTNKFDFEGVLQTATTRKLDDAVLAAYKAPFPNNNYIAGVRRFPTLVASQLRQNQKVINDFYSKWDKPLLTAYGSEDKLMAGMAKVWQENVPGAKGQAHTQIQGAHHFIQDDTPEEITHLLIEFMKNNK